MKNFTVQIDDKLDHLLDQMKESLGKTSRAEVFRLGLALLKMAIEARDRGEKIAIANSEDRVVKEILIPGQELVGGAR